MPRFSIIVPVYNVAKYLRGCLASIQSQTLTDFECLLVDDGSTDASAAIIDEIATADPRFKAFHKQNGGVSSARNMGLDHAQGEYICFVDADDTIASTYLEDLHKTMGEGADSAMCGFQVRGTRDDRTYTVVPDTSKTESLEENLLEFYDYHQSYWQHYLWNRMFRRAVIEAHHLRFREDIYYKEDGLFVVQYLCRSNGLVGCMDKVDYYYNTDNQGAIAKIAGKFDPRLITNLKAHQLIIVELKRFAIASAVMTKAIDQAKSVANWIVIAICNYGKRYFYMIPQVEWIMLQILGFCAYSDWRLTRLIRTRR